MSKAGKSFSYSNIALIKYWGKLDVENNIPSNSSISISLPNLKTETIIYKNNSSSKDIFILNGENICLKDRMIRLINYFRNHSKDYSSIRIESTNNFPHSCGLASSASGYSALVKALNEYYRTRLSVENLCELARIGSGSACRSMYDGIVIWECENVYKIGEWDELRIFNIIVSKEEKRVGSTEGMIRTMKTSTFIHERLRNIKERIELACEYLKVKDFKKLGVLVMKEANEIHSTCLDSYPPILYLTEKSMEIVYEVFKMNKENFEVFYSFDAGPNPFIFVLNENFQKVFDHFKELFGYEIIVCK